MIQEKQLILAAAEYEESLLSALSNIEPEDHSFSKKFESDMDKLCKKVRRRPVFAVLKRVAVIVLISALLAGSLALTNPTVRAAIVEWAKEIIEDIYSFTPKDTPKNIQGEYELSWLPSGYKLSSQSQESYGYSLVYKCASKPDITFTYLFTYNNGADYVFTEPTLVRNVTVFDNPAKIHIFSNPKKPKAIVWLYQNNRIQFLITADVDDEILIKLAESIVLTKDNTHKNPTFPPSAD